MALVCGSRVSTEAVACPHCGVAQPAPPKRHPALRVGLLVICIAIAAGIWVKIRGGPNSGGQSALVATSPVRVNADPAAATAGHQRSAAEWAAQFEQQAEVKTEESHRDKTASNETAADGDKAALIKALPKTGTKEDMEAAAQAAKKKQAAEKAKQELAAPKVKPPPASGDAEIYLAQEAIRKIMREPSSAVFEDVFFVDDRKSETGDYVPVVCGTVNGRNGFGGMTGPRHFVAIMAEQAQGLWLEGTTPQNVIREEWNRFCAGSH